MKNDFNFENLTLYKKALSFVDKIYHTISLFPKEEKYSLCDQLKRAAISIALNIAEGYGQTNLQFKRYLNIAKGSVRECVAIITIAKNRTYIDTQAEKDLRQELVEISKMISGLIKSLDE
jgi:four helix bundle protein